MPSPEAVAVGSAKQRSRRLLLLLAALFFGPVVLALVLNINAPGWLPFGATNNGTLVQPVQSLTANGLRSISDGTPFAFDHRWTLLVVARDHCRKACDAALYATRQARLGLGRDYQRLRRVLVAAPKALPKAPAIASDHPDLTLFHAADEWWRQLPFTALDGVVYVIDPQQNILLYYPPLVVAPALIDDLTRLLKISQIG